MHASVRSVTAARVALVNLSVRITPEIATALRHAILARKTEGCSPTSTYGIVEEVLRHWLQVRGFLPAP
jgi:hypothetical protein